MKHFGLYKKYGNKEFRNKVSRWFYHEENLNDVFKDIKKKFPERYQIIKEGFNFSSSEPGRAPKFSPLKITGLPIRILS